MQILHPFAGSVRQYAEQLSDPDFVDEVAEAIGADRFGVRLSPFGQYGGIHDSDPAELSVSPSGNSASAASRTYT